MARWRPFVEDCAHSQPIEPETESVFLCKLSDLCFSIRLVWRPNANQLMLINRALVPFASSQLAFDQRREGFHTAISPIKCLPNRVQCPNRKNDHRPPHPVGVKGGLVPTRNTYFYGNCKAKVPNILQIGESLVNRHQHPTIQIVRPLGINR